MALERRKQSGQAWETAEVTNGGSQTDGALLQSTYLFTEEATAGTYSATFGVSAGMFIADVSAYQLGVSNPGLTGWAADTALLTIGDTVNSAGYANGFDLVPPNTLYDLQGDPAQAILGGAVSGIGSGGGWSGADYADASLNAISEGAASPGMYYPSADTITMEIVTTIASPPVVPGGVLLVKIAYFTAVTAVAATFA